MTKVNFESVSATDSGPVYSVNGKVKSITISAERVAEIGAELDTLRERVAALEAFHEAARELDIMGLIPDLDQWENAEGEPIAVLVKWYIDTFRMAGGE